MKTIQMTIDERLLKIVDKMTRARKTTRSAFIRHALEAESRRQRIREDEVRHVAGYAHQPISSIGDMVARQRSTPKNPMT